MSKSTDRPQRARRMRRLFATIGVLSVVAVLAFQAAVAWWPNPPDRAGRPQATATLLLDRDGGELAVLAGVDGQFHLPLSADQAGPWLAQAVMAVEDARFREHAGVDWQSVVAAAWEDLSTLSIRRGASTIPMQVIRLRDPQPRSLAGKVMQAVRATQLMRRADHDEVLLEYLNSAPFGGNLVGAASASWRYFGKPCTALTLAEAATLAGLPQSPNRLRPDRHPEAAQARRNHVLHRMLACRMIAPQQHAQAIAEPVIARWRPLPQNQPNAPAATAMPTLAHLTIGRPGGVLRTTIDPVVQSAAADLARLHLGQLPTAADDLAAAVVVLDTPSGQCLAAVNAGPAAGDLDLTHRRRSTGSTLKPFIYALAFEEGVCGPDTLVADGPAGFSGYTPRNFDRTFHGQVPASEALAQSRNIPAMDLLSRVGVSRTGRLLRDLGLRHADHPERYGLTLAIGGAEASPIELAGAFATLARGGQHVPPQLVPDRSPGLPPRLLAGTVCVQVLRALSDPARAARVSPAAAGRRVAWKTGTSSDQRDAWCAAVSAERTVVVWIGKPAASGDAALVGAEAAAPLAMAVLIGSSSSSPPANAAVAANASTPTLPSAQGRRLAIVSPRHHQEFILDPAAPPESQQIRLQVDHRGGEAVFWFVNADPLAAGDADRLWWRPTPGTHTIHATTATGESTTVQITVRPLGNRQVAGSHRER